LVHFKIEPEASEIIKVVRNYCFKVGVAEEQEKLFTLFADDETLQRLAIATKITEPRKLYPAIKNEYVVITQDKVEGKDLFEIDTIREEINKKIEDKNLPYDIFIDALREEIFAFGKKADMRMLQIKFLLAVLRRNGKVCKYNDFLGEVWGSYVSKGAIQFNKYKIVSMIKELRKYIGSKEHGYYLRTDEVEKPLKFFIIAKNFSG